MERSILAAPMTVQKHRVYIIRH